MWTREELKERAKTVLRKYYWIALLVTIVSGILGGSSKGFGSNFRWNYGGGSGSGGFTNWNWQSTRWDSPETVQAVLAIIAGALAVSTIVLVFVALGMAFRIFVGGPISVGMSRYFLEARQDRSDFVNLFYSFRQGRYLGAVKAMAWQLLFTFLWTLLFIIPGIVKGYAYSMIPYIMADNPGMDYRRAMTLSMAMTNGEKGDMFVLDLSFIGWYLLGLLACCIGVVFVEPYYWATKAELYVTLRQKAIERGLCTPDELGQPIAEPVV